jgi:hypothetical protein
MMYVFFDRGSLIRKLSCIDSMTSNALINTELAVGAAAVGDVHLTLRAVCVSGPRFLALQLRDRRHGIV